MSSRIIIVLALTLLGLVSHGVPAAQQETPQTRQDEAPMPSEVSVDLRPINFSDSPLHFKCDGEDVLSLEDLIEVFETTKSCYTRVIAATVLTHLADKLTVRRHLNSKSLPVRTWFRWIKLKRIRDAEFLASDGAEMDEALERKWRGKAVAFIDELSGGLGTECPTEFKVIVSTPLTGFQMYDPVFDFPKKVEEFERFEEANGFVKFEADPRRYSGTLAELSEGRSVLAHVWIDDRLYVALSRNLRVTSMSKEGNTSELGTEGATKSGGKDDETPIDRDSCQSGDHDLNDYFEAYCEIVCLKDGGTIVWKQTLRAWPQYYFPNGFYEYVRLSISKDKKSVIVFSTCPGESDAPLFGIESLDATNGSLMFSFFSDTRELFPTTLGVGRG